jgi:colanic acid/amylovoran biosynthesis glycosyltransferase
VSQYPAANHTFILREIMQLRRMGMEIRVASIRDPDRPFERLTADEQNEQSATFYVKAAGVTGLLLANLRVFFSRPISYLRTLAYALRLAFLDVRKSVFNLFYLAEALVLVDWMRRERLSHLHMHFSSNVGLLARCLLPMRTSVTIHGPDEFTEPASFYLREKIEAFDLLCSIGTLSMEQIPCLPSRCRSRAVCSPAIPRKSVTCRNPLRGQAGASEGSAYFDRGSRPSGT